MATMSTGNFPQDLRPGINEWFGAKYKIYDSKFDKILDVKIPEDRAYEEDVMMSGLTLATLKTQGAPVTYDMGNQLFSTRYVHLQYGNGFIITEEMLEDGVALKLGKLYAESLKEGMIRTREIFAALVYINGFTAAYTGTGLEGGDGAALFSASHPSPAGNLSNVPSTPASLSEAALEQAIIDIQNFKDNRGQLIMAIPDKLVLPLNLQFTAERILRSPLRSGTNDNDINAIRNMEMLPGGVIVDPYLTSTTNWFVKTNQPGLNFFNRKDIQLSDDNDFDTNNMKVKGLMRFSAGYSDFRAGYGVNI